MAIGSLPRGVLVSSALKSTNAALLSRPALAASPLKIPNVAKLTAPIVTARSPAAVAVAGPSVDVAYTQNQADAAADKLPVTLIAAGVGAVAVGLFVVMQLRKKR